MDQNGKHVDKIISLGYWLVMLGLIALIFVGCGSQKIPRQNKHQPARYWR